MSNATLLVYDAGYHCPECLRPVRFEPTANAYYATEYIGQCVTPRCDRNGIRLKIKLRTIEVEELPTTEENPHGAQDQSPRINGG